MSPSPVTTPGEPPTGLASYIPGTTSSGVSCCKLHLRRDSSTSSFDTVDRMEWLTYEVSVPYFFEFVFYKNVIYGSEAREFNVKSATNVKVLVMVLLAIRDGFCHSEK